MILKNYVDITGGYRKNFIFILKQTFLKLQANSVILQAALILHCTAFITGTNINMLHHTLPHAVDLLLLPLAAESFITIITILSVSLLLTVPCCCHR